MHGNNIVYTSQAIASSIATHALIVDPVAVSILIEQILQVVWITPAGYTLCQAVAESDDHWIVTASSRLGCRRRTGTAGTRRHVSAFFSSRSTIRRIRGSVAPAENPNRGGCNNEKRSLSAHIFKIDMLSSTVQTDIIQVRQLSKTIENPPSRVEILRDVTFAVPRGQFLAIMGASGSGKSTLLGLMAGLDTVTSGIVVLDGIDITHLREDDLARLRGRKIGFVFQSYQLVPTLTAEENVLLPAELTGSGDNPRRRAKDLLMRVGLSNRAHHYPVQLSGGEQQRVALAGLSLHSRRF